MTTTPEQQEKSPNRLTTLKIAAWLGWLIESNWTDPLTFAIYSIIRPISSAAILIVMYLVIRGGDFANPDFVNIYIGNAFYILVGAAIQGVSFGILDDREHYRTLKYLYIAPIRIPVYLIGRSIASILIASLSVIITLVFGVLFLDLPIQWAGINWGLLLVTMVLGLMVMVSIGLILGGWTLIIKNNAWSLGESLGAGLFIFSGAVFPLSVLPRALEVIGYLFPVGYWLVLIRRAIVPGIGKAYPMLTSYSNQQLLLILAGFAVLSMLAAMFTFKRFDYIARERGNIDMISNY
ncbi:MAG: ABC transporter permease [Anaerolineaceae bacterium]